MIDIKEVNTMDMQKIEALTDRILNDINAAMSCLNLYIGHRLDLFRTLVEYSPVSSTELAVKTGYNERYVREWLECMAVNGYIEHDDEANRFSISPEYGTVLSDQDNSSYMASFLCWIPSLAGVIEPLMEAFRSGGGVPYEDYGADTLEAVGMGNRPMFVNDYVDIWIPALPEIKTILEDGGRVAEIGCGVGWSSISLAKGFPNVKIDAFDMDRASIEQARANAEKAGVSDSITFHLAAAESIEHDTPYDLVTAFECIHDMAYPVKALNKMKNMLAPNGIVLISDEAAGENLKENSNFLGRFLYNFSVLHCLPQAMVFPDSAGTGTAMSVSTLRKYAIAAGFTKIDILPIDNPFWRFYRLDP
jgi:ubiquinone/menaquinone biosynthesis C-methylase UbiE